jgi:hypothetical protein
VRGEEFHPWRAPCLRMPRHPPPRPKRPRSPTRRRGEESSERGAEETPTDDEVVERRTKMRHDPAYANRPSRTQAGARMPSKRRGRVVAISSEEEEPLSPRGEEFDIQQDFRYAPKPVSGRFDVATDVSANVSPAALNVFSNMWTSY